MDEGATGTTTACIPLLFKLTDFATVFRWRNLPVFCFCPRLPHEFLPQTRWGCCCLGTAVGSGAPGAPRPGPEAQGRGCGRGVPAGPAPLYRRCPRPPAPSCAGAGGGGGRAAPRAGPRSPPPPSPHPPMRTRRCLRRVSGSLRVSSTFCVDFRTSPCGFLENIPPGPAPAPRSRGGQRPPDPPAPGPLHSRRQRQQRQQRQQQQQQQPQRRLLLLLLRPPPPPGRRGWRGPAGAGPGLGSPFLPPSLALLPLLHDSRQVRPRPSLWQPRRDVTAGGAAGAGRWLGGGAGWELRPAGPRPAPVLPRCRGRLRGPACCSARR